MGSGISRAYPPAFSIATSIRQKGQVKTKRRYNNGMSPEKGRIIRLLSLLLSASGEDV